METDIVKQGEMKDKIKKKYLRRTRKLHETKLSGRNLTKGINTCVVSLVRFSGSFVKWTREEANGLKKKEMHMALHPGDDVDKLYVLKKEEGRGLASIEGSVGTSIQRLEDNKEKNEGGLITAIKNDTDNRVTNRMT